MAKYMIAKQEERITIMELVGEVDRLVKIYSDVMGKKKGAREGEGESSMKSKMV